MAKELKPCPFCGGEVEIINAEDLTINGKSCICSMFAMQRKNGTSPI